MNSSLDYNTTIFADPLPSTFKALEHLCAAVTSVEKVTTKADVTLGILGEVVPLVKKFKRMERVKEDGGRNSRNSSNNSLDGTQSPSRQHGGEGEENGNEICDDDTMNFDAYGNVRMSAVDKRLHDYIESEFLRLSRDPKTKKPNFRQVFEEMDEDGSGRLDYGELRQAMIKLGIVLNQEQMSLLIKNIDIDGDGDVNYIEFMRFMNVENGDVTVTEIIEDALTSVSRAIFLVNNSLFFNVRAELYFRLHDLKSCVSNLRFVLKLLPGDAVTRKRLAKVLDLQGHEWLSANSPKPAISCFTEACKLDPIVASYWVRKSVALVMDRNFSDALRNIEQAMSVEKPTADLLCLRGKVQWALDLMEAGNRDFRSAQELDPSHPEVLNFMSFMIKKSSGFYNQAMQALQNAKNAGGDCDLSEVIRLLTQALSLTPDDMRLLILRAKANRQAGNLQDSLSDIDDATFAYLSSMLGDEAPRHVPNRRMWLEEQSLKNYYKEPVIITQQRNLTYNEMALQFAQNDEPERAISLLNKVIEAEYHLHDKDMGKVDPKYFVNRGDCYRAINHIEQAMSDFNRAFDSDPTNWQTTTRLSMIHYMAGLQLFNEGLYNSSEIEFTIAIKHNCNVSQYFASRGKAYFYQHLLDKAYDDYKEALRLDPNNQDVLMRIQQFDPSSNQSSNSNISNPKQKGKITLGGDLGHSLSSLSLKNTRSQTSFLPSVVRDTQPTALNPHLKNAVVVKDFVTTKRRTVRRELSVNQRRKAHPLKKGAAWSVMETKKVEWKSLTQRSKTR